MPTCLCLQCFISVREKVFISVCDCGITHVYGKLVCINSDDNKEVIGEQLQLGSDGGATMDIT